MVAVRGFLPALRCLFRLLQCVGASSRRLLQAQSYARRARADVRCVDVVDMPALCHDCFQPRQRSPLLSHVPLVRVRARILSDRVLHLSHHGGQKRCELVFLRRGFNYMDEFGVEQAPWTGNQVCGLNSIANLGISESYFISRYSPLK
ncbi:hypothetical protein KC19_11G150400 [Ceratodon purpureus]|uniref:Secreted protein n=1 Tax=Ceratodon purpureus TaxID=3225 RepID=A0A8T0GF90_CERPU|nr:hypothetical protein KC19_11G150400 [Ceratodon purpureus]